MVSGVLKTTNGGKATFFPKHWKPQQVIDAINESYGNKKIILGTRNTYQGISADGIKINMYLNKEGKIMNV